MREHERLDTGGLRDSTCIFCRRLMREDAFLQRRRIGIRNAAHETIDCRRIHDGVDEYVGAVRELYEVV